jgi:DNA-directed RNA polymerase subunit alpha
VKFHTENFRVEQKTDFEKLVMDITTDGSIHPKEALKEAAKILIQHFLLFSDQKITFDLPLSNNADNVDNDDTTLITRQFLQSKLADMDLSVRAQNCLKSAELETLGDLVAIQKSDLLKFRNFGKKSLAELEDLVKSKGLEFGMNISKYKLDND